MSEITLGRISSRAGYTVTFISFHYFSFAFPFPSAAACRPSTFHENTILCQNMCKSQEKKYFSLQKGELENNSMNSNCNTITTTDC